jgi:glycosyltransferase involved in cell wall biosynthesis
MTTPIAPQESWMGGEETAVANLVSVIIPNYNHASYLPHAIDSVLRQDYRSHEIIVVDDGSTDHSREIAAGYSEQICYIWQENQGLSAARNTGLRAARGEYIALLDADDMLEADFLTTLVAFLKDNPRADGTICGYRFVDDDNNPLPQGEARDLSPDTLYTVLLDGNFLVPESLLLHRRCYAFVGPFDETLRACEDWDMWLRISCQFTLLSVPRLLTRHRVLSGSMSSNPERMLTNRLAVLNKHFGSEPKDLTEGKPVQRRAFARAYLNSAVEYMQVREVHKAYRCLSKMAHVAPHILAELDTFYELALGDQPKGRRGDYTSVNLDWSKRTVEQMLTRLSTEVAVTRPYRRIAYNQFHYALAMLYHGARQPANVRHHLWRSFYYAPQQIFNYQWLASLVKMMLPRSSVHALRSGVTKQLKNHD